MTEVMISVPGNEVISVEGSMRPRLWTELGRTGDLLCGRDIGPLTV